MSTYGYAVVEIVELARKKRVPSCWASSSTHGTRPRPTPTSCVTKRTRMAAQSCTSLSNSSGSVSRGEVHDRRTPGPDTNPVDQHRVHQLERDYWQQQYHVLIRAEDGEKISPPDDKS